MLGGGRNLEPQPCVSDAIRCYRSLLRSCALGQSPPATGQKIHATLLKAGLLPLFLTPAFSSSSTLCNALFHMYAAVGPTSSALRAFREIPPPARSPADWTALISCHASRRRRRHALLDRALLLFRFMRRAGVPPDEVTLVSLLSVAARLADPASGASAHVLLLKLGLSFTAPACNAAMDMYAKCGRMPDARRLFDEMHAPNVVSWTVILAGSIRWEGLCSGREVFDRMPQKNQVSWTVMIAACVEAGLPREAMSLIEQMLFGDGSIRNLNHISMCSLLSTCSQAGDLTVGRWVHTHVTKTGLLDDHHILMVNTALIDMYGKCGNIDTARKLFKTVRHRNLVVWNAMLSGLSMHGKGDEVLHLFSQMVSEEAQLPDDITLVAVLSACSRSGLVEQGRMLFHDLGSVYGLTPKVEHYACMVDLFGRVGRLEEAEALVREMPVRPNEVVLGSLLASCCLHGKLELGRSLLQELVQMYPNNTDYHALLSNTYSSYGRHAEADDLWQAIKKGGVRKGPSMSFIEINGHVHRFSAGDRSHPQTRQVYVMLDEVVRRLRLAGYVANAASQTSRVSDGYLGNGDEREEGEQALLAHSERLAISFGLISTRPGAPLRIFKNLRICFDCHSAVKLISDIFKREITIRDRNRFHCFKQGLCSCSDYW